MLQSPALGSEQAATFLRQRADHLRVDPSRPRGASFGVVPPPPSSTGVDTVEASGAGADRDARSTRTARGPGEGGAGRPPDSAGRRGAATARPQGRHRPLMLSYRGRFTSLSMPVMARMAA